MPRRFLCLYFPRLTADRLEREDPQLAAAPFAVAAEDRGHLYVDQPNGLARQAGVRPGMRLADARALLPTLRMVLDDEEANAALQRYLAGWCHQYSPIAARDGRDGMALDIAGCPRLFGGEAAMLEAILAGLRALGICARGAIADAPAAAWALARFSSQTIVSSEELAAALDPLPVRALRLPAEIATELERVGLTAIGHMRRVPRDPLAARYGPATLLRLDQALGLAAESIVPYDEPAPYRAGRVFAEPIGSTEAVAQVILELLTTLCARLETEHRGARRYALLCHRVDGSVAELEARTSRPVRSITHLMRLFAEKLNGFHAGFGIEAATLRAVGVEDVAPVQLRLPECGESVEENTPLDELLDRMGLRLGFERVRRVRIRPTLLPEHSLEYVPVTSAAGSGAPWPEHRLRPVRLLETPAPIEVAEMIPGNCPVRIRVGAQMHRIVRAEGPERLTPEWWRLRPAAWAARDYYRIEDEEGARLWIFRETARAGGERWFLHGQLP